MDSEISVIDETFDSTITSSYFLSIQVTLDGFSFCTIDPVRNEYIQFCHFNIQANDLSQTTESLDKIFRQSDLLNLPFKKVFVLVSSPYSTLVPSGIFEPANAREWLSFCHTLPPGYDILNTKMKLADAWNVFAIPSGLTELFKRQYREPLFFHHYTPLVETKLAVNRTGKGNNLVLINIQTDSFNLVVLEKNNLKLCNTFKIKGENDLLYFTLFVFDQLRISPRESEVLLSGEHSSFAGIAQMLGVYLKNIENAGLPDGFRYSHVFKEVPGTRFHNLLTVASCV